MNTPKYVIKKNGYKELFDPEKINEKAILACDGLNDVSPSEIVIRASRMISNGMTTDDIQKILVKTAADLISEEKPNYEIVAARLLNQQIRKEVYGQYEPLPFKDEVLKRVKKGIYDRELLKDYSIEEIEYFGKKIRYSKDDKFKHAGLLQLYKKYLINRYGKVVETPQEMFMLINMYIFAKYPKDKRKKWVIEGYKILSDFEVSLPTPIMIGVRSHYRRFISCNGIDVGDSIHSIANALKAIPLLTASRSGIGLNVGNIRGLGAYIDGGRVIHTGITPIIRSFQTATGMFTQEGRGGSSTNFLPFFHIEVETYLILKNNKGTEEKRARYLDYTIIFNKLFYKRVYSDDYITLFYMNDVPGLYDMIGSDKFEEMYEYYENTIPKKRQVRIKANDLFELYLKERFETARVYLMNGDHSNSQSNYKVPIKQSNLCLEILQPASPLERYEIKEVRVKKENIDRYNKYRREEDKRAYDLFEFVDGSEKGCDDYYYVLEKFTDDNKFYRGEIFVCILAALQLGFIKRERIPIITEYIVRFLDELIDYQEYVLPEVEYAAKKRRGLGVGISDLFHFLAKQKISYNTKEARDLIHEWMEDISYYLHSASVELAKERGRCDLFNETKFSDNSLIIDRYMKTVDDLVSVGLKRDWEKLRKDIKRYGIRNSTLVAIAPTSNSSRVANATPGVEPPRKLLNIKKDGKMIFRQLVPEFSKLRKYYTTAWSDDFNNSDYLKLLAVINKFTDQAISTNQYIDLRRYDDGKYPLKEYKKYIFDLYKYGLKTLYYANIKTPNKNRQVDDEIEEDIDCKGGGCKI